MQYKCQAIDLGQIIQIRYSVITNKGEVTATAGVRANGMF